MSIHIGARPGDIAKTVLISGDPIRAKVMAERYLKDLRCYNEIRGMYGFTGLYNGQEVSIQGTGMGIPSTAIYVNELIDFYGVEQIVRIGSCGAMQEDLALGDILIAMSASTDSSMNRSTFDGMDFAANADFSLLNHVYTQSLLQGKKVAVGNILSTDTFYQEDSDRWKVWARHGVLGVEMESNCIYTIAARKAIRALSLLTVSDNLTNCAEMPAKERESSFDSMMELAFTVL